MGVSYLFPGGSDGKESTSNARNLGLIPGLGRLPGGGHDNPLLPGESPGTEEPGRILSMGLQRVGHDCVLRFMGLQRVRHD